MRQRNLRHPGLPQSIIQCLWIVCVGLGPASGVAAQGAGGALAASILRSTKVKGGLCVLLGCEDTALAVGLSQSGPFLVHCLYPDRERADEARKGIQSRGVYGRVSADRASPTRLPYADNLVNLLVADNLAALLKSGFSVEEMLRVLCPDGVAYLGESAASRPGEEAWVAELKARLRAAGAGEVAIVREAGTWARIVKPRPKDIDEWTHWLHGADRNAVARDSVVGPPRHVQWADGPLWLRHHNTVPSISAMVSASGRLFTICDEAPAGIRGMPDQWFLIARDAFNGVFLWKRPIARWGWRQWSDREISRFNQPTHIPRRLVAVGDRVYVTLGFNAPLTALDAATGKTVRTYPGTEFTSEVLVHDGTLILAVSQAAQKPGRVKQKPPEKKHILAIQADTGALLWKKGDFVGISSKADSMERITHLTLAIGGGRVFFLEEDAVVSLDLATGKELWRAPRPRRRGAVTSFGYYFSNLCSLVYHQGVVLFARPELKGKRAPWNAPVSTSLAGIAATTGKTLWTHECGTWGHYNPADVFAIDGLVWVHDASSFSMLGLDVGTGKVARKFSSAKALNQGHHHRCYRNKATERYVLTGRRGVEFIDVKSERITLHHWTRGACRFGILPCNGLLYVPPHPCICYITAKLNGLLVLAPKRQRAPAVASPRLERGPAYGQIGNRQSAIGNPHDWPT